MARKAAAAPAGELALDLRLQRLEEIVAAMDREDLELEDALRLFEEGVQHMRAAQEVLRQTELRIERLLEDAAGDIRVEPQPRARE